MSHLRHTLRVQALGRWDEDETFNLQVAFGNQTSRVEDEWGAFHQQLDNDYAARRAAIEGRAAESRATPSPSARWKEKEKQERLIHTAPVHSPTAELPASPKQATAAGGGGLTTASARREMQQLDVSYRQAKEQFKVQKQSALRWIERQAVRMYAQAASHGATTST